ncbi:MAG: pyridoxamine 5'-phosphate oxidase [Alphaproteobacteria bacterium]|nr:pyridoxamine 5'-phosphate oxidase family protein [Alphaproteobacteria bacterium]TAD90284.1 MAG: pyridoxamine 5'-phosphate oxidase [Alphaproteobacteria bacterium]
MLDTSPSRTTMAGLADDLSLALDTAWGHLMRGAADRRSGFHTIGLGTTGLDGTPQLRTVVLRRTDREQRELFLHTDIRARKIPEILAKPEVGVLGYCQDSKTQLRLSGVATIHHDDGIARAAWERAQEMSRRCYRVPIAPGSAIERPTDEPEALPVPGDPNAGFEAFAVVRVTIHRLEWLYLAITGHRRARYEWRDGALTATWLVP